MMGLTMRDTRLITQEYALETLAKFRITDDELAEWESELDLDIPTDTHGNKIYSRLHLNLFKNIKKHRALGRSLDEIKRLVILPRRQESSEDIITLPTGYGHSSVIDFPARQTPENQPEQEAEREIEVEKARQSDVKIGFADILTGTSSPQPTISQAEPAINQANPTFLPDNLLHLPEIAPSYQQSGTSGLPVAPSNGQIRRFKRYASAPVSIADMAANNQPGQNAGLVILIERLMQEKDGLQEQITYLEKQKAHLQKANELFQQRLEELSRQMGDLQTQLSDYHNFKLIDDKSRLQKQLLESEQRMVEAEKRLVSTSDEIKQLRSRLADKANPELFIGNWLEEAELKEISFDNFGINIESKRNRMFRITTPPERLFGQSAIIETPYDYQANTLWKRTETLILSIISANRLEGELIVEYTLDGTPVAKANYRVRCYRNGIKPEQTA